MGDQLFLERFVWFDNAMRRWQYPNASSLAEHFEIASKSGQRSIEYFRDRLQAPLEYDSSRKGYYYADLTFQLPVIRLSEAELLALLISRKLISEAAAGPLAEELGSVSKRLASLLAVNLPGRADPENAFSFRWKNVRPTDPQVFKTVTSALLQGKLLSFCYASPTATDCSTRTVEPHHLVNYMGSWHLFAYCHLRGDWRNFVLGRMMQCSIADETFEFRGTEEWQPFLNNTYGIFSQRECFDVVLKFTPQRSRLVRGEVWHEGQTEELLADGSLVITVPVPHEAEIIMEILRHGSQVEVLEPEWLREMVIAELQAAVKKYVT